MFHLKKMNLRNYKCFERLDIHFEKDVTVIFAENAGGKTAILSALAIMLGQLLPKEYMGQTLNVQRDARRVRDKEGRWQTDGICKLLCYASLANYEDVQWSIKRSPKSAYDLLHIENIIEAIEQARQNQNRWPLIAYYGTGRLAELSQGSRPEWMAFRMPPQVPRSRMDGYGDCLNPSTRDDVITGWLRLEAFGDLARKERGEPERGFRHAIVKSMKDVVPELLDLWYDPAVDEIKAKLSSGDELGWSELSDGFHIMLGLVGDIARRAVILNEQDGLEAPRLAEGVVLIDEIDLHLHPKWQRTVIPSLRRAFPNLQWIVTTHSPQVLSSAENRQARMLSERVVDDQEVKIEDRLVHVHQGGIHRGQMLDEREILIEGRDSNAILRDWMNTNDRDNWGSGELRALHEAIDAGRIQEAEQKLATLQTLWGKSDPSLVYAEKILEWERRDAEELRTTETIFKETKAKSKNKKREK